MDHPVPTANRAEVRRFCPEARNKNTVSNLSNAHLCRTLVILCSFPLGTLPHFVLTVAWEVSSEPSFYTQEREGYFWQQFQEKK